MNLYIATVNGQLDHPFRVTVEACNEWEAQTTLHRHGYSIQVFPQLNERAESGVSWPTVK